MGRYTLQELEHIKKNGTFPKCGHPYTPENQYTYKGSGTICKICHAERRRMWHLNYYIKRTDGLPAPRVETRTRSGSGEIAGRCYATGYANWPRGKRSNGSG